jgi:hypothetical protein
LLWPPPAGPPGNAGIEPGLDLWCARRLADPDEWPQRIQLWLSRPGLARRTEEKLPKLGSLPGPPRAWTAFAGAEGCMAMQPAPHSDPLAVLTATGARSVLILDTLGCPAAFMLPWMAKHAVHQGRKVSGAGAGAGQPDRRCCNQCGAPAPGRLPHTQADASERFAPAGAHTDGGILRTPAQVCNAQSGKTAAGRLWPGASCAVKSLVMPAACPAPPRPALQLPGARGCQWDPAGGSCHSDQVQPDPQTRPRPCCMCVGACAGLGLQLAVRRHSHLHPIATAQQQPGHVAG